MIAKRRKTVDVSRDRWTVYANKSRQFLKSMESALAAGDRDAAGLNAVHSAISAADALVVYYAGVRSSGESHLDAAGLLELHVKGEGAASKAKSLAKILSFKNVAAYEAREFTEREAQELAKITRRFYDWARKLLV
ncbi:MAG: HEPN domain-containing protein [Elusimicrobiota bacterium]